MGRVSRGESPSHHSLGVLMIFVFVEDGTLDIIDGLADARRNYHGAAVERASLLF